MAVCVGFFGSGMVGKHEEELWFVFRFFFWNFESCCEAVTVSLK